MKDEKGTPFPPEGRELAVAQMAMVTPSADQHGYIEAVIRAEVQAQTALALARPRSFDQARVTLLADCRRPGFAEEAEWEQERWDSRKRRMVAITGPSIRLAEGIKRAWTNMVTNVFIIHEDAHNRIVRVQVRDLEANLADSQDVIIAKKMERRREPKDPDELIGTRTNANGDVIYICEVPESEMLLKTNAAVSRIKRNLIIQAVPADLVEEARAECRKTRTTTDAKDPDAARKKIVDAFAFDLKVAPDALAKFLGHAIDQCSPAELDGLRGIYRAIHDGQTTWADVANPEAGKDDGTQDPAQAAAQVVRDKMRKGREQAKEASAPNGTGKTPPPDAEAGQKANGGVVDKDAKDPDARESFKAACKVLNYDEETTAKWAAEKGCPLDSPWTTAQATKMRTAVQKAGGHMA